MKPFGLVGFINPNKYFYSDYGEGIREVITSDNSIEKIIDFNEFQVFNGITTYTTINIFSKNKKNSSFIYSSINNKNLNKNIVENFLLKKIENKEISSVKIETKIYLNQIGFLNLV